MLIGWFEGICVGKAEIVGTDVGIFVGFNVEIGSGVGPISVGVIVVGVIGVGAMVVGFIVGLSFKQNDNTNTKINTHTNKT